MIWGPRAALMFLLYSLSRTFNFFGLGKKVNYVREANSFADASADVVFNNSTEIDPLDPRAAGLTVDELAELNRIREQRRQRVYMRAARHRKRVYGKRYNRSMRPRP